ncbi:COX15/CtaA family protein [Rhodohalobacter sp. 614A]|uniref:COX15/CtaA family protein n=1 Tax=Rhodohalobacter sp. 614A TaxID=2908649 RepID=UPI001F15A590|nr:COX15/CtaA family protein [Rhodohalobacter sp. 614A]
MTERDKKHVRTWYWSGAVLIFVMVVIGGITRLTGSGLSMTDWNPIMGAIPPLSEAQWEEVFEQYKQFPEYREINYNMTLPDFKAIFFWEYIHRLLGRIIGLVFIIPFAWFVIKKKVDARNIKRGIILFVLGLSQGLLGWFMVMSGLVDVPEVSHYRLAAHLLLAFSIFGFCVWYAQDLTPSTSPHEKTGHKLKGWLYLLMVLLVIQIMYGAFVANLQAGHIYNTFPKMYQHWAPPELWVIKPVILNFFENIVTIQWLHRVFGTLLGLMVIAILIRTFLLDAKSVTKRWSIALFTIVLVQYLIGIFTLLLHVPIWLGVLHQTVALVLFGVILGFLNYLNQPGSLGELNA